MKILYLGPKFGTSLQRAATLERLGHEVLQIDPMDFVPSGRLISKFHYESGGLFAQGRVAKGLLAEIDRLRPKASFDLAWVNGGRFVGPDLIDRLRSMCGKVVNYNNDDPYGKRDRFSWALYLRSVPYYDLAVVVRALSVPEAKARGAKDVLFVKMSGDEVAHRPRTLTPEDIKKWSSDVIFVGTWMPERGPFMSELLDLGVPLTIYGSNWQKAREWPKLQSVWKGPGMSNPDEYSKALQCAKVTLGLLSKGNRDMHTQRSSEIPALGALFCAERTPEHEEMYQDGYEAVFWSDAKECAAQCQKMLSNEELRSQIAARGRERVLKNGTMNELTMQAILDRTFGSSAPAS